MSKLDELKRHLRPGRIYRRSDLVKWSSSVDRHIKQLVESGKLRKLATGIYYCPKQTAFGASAADDREMVSAFLKDGRFLLTTPNVYNALGVGATQLYNRTVVYNHKRHGVFSLGGRTFDFQKKSAFPRNPTPEFFLVDMVNNLGQLAEDEEHMLAGILRKIPSMEPKKLKKAVAAYAGVRARKFFDDAIPSS
jgi:hypothetical protein